MSYQNLRKEAQTPMVQLNLLKRALGFESTLSTETIIQYIEDGLVKVKHGKDVPEQDEPTEQELSSLASQEANVSQPDAPDVNDPAKVVETPEHKPEPTAVKPTDAKVETPADKPDQSVTKDVIEEHKQAKEAEKNEPVKAGEKTKKEEEKK